MSISSPISSPPTFTCLSRYPHHRKLSLSSVVDSLDVDVDSSLYEGSVTEESEIGTLSPISVTSSFSSEPSTPTHEENTDFTPLVTSNSISTSLSAILESVYTSFFTEPFNWSNAMSWAKPPRSLSSPLRYTMVLDLDETLLHSFFPEKISLEQRSYLQALVRAEERAESEGQLTRLQRTMYEVDVGDGTLVITVLRPHCHTFLSALFDKYDVGVWSAGGRTYVESICKVIFPQEVVNYKPMFEMCWEDVQVEQTNGAGVSYTKPLTTITSRLTSVSLNHLILIDNRPENACYFPNQLVHVPDYYPDPFVSLQDNDTYLSVDALTQIDLVVSKMELVNKQNNWMAKRESVCVALQLHADQAYQQQLEALQEEEQQKFQDETCQIEGIPEHTPVL